MLNHLPAPESPSEAYKTLSWGRYRGPMADAAFVSELPDDPRVELLAQTLQRLSCRVCAFVCAGLLGLSTATPASALKGSVGIALTSIPTTTTAEAITLLNRQREANGIPGELVNDPALSAGCEEYANRYKPKPGQYPHEELQSQPGYTAAGSEAASSSDLGGGVGGWTSVLNPWETAPLHLNALFDPAATTTWYGETRDEWGAGSVCMGTSEGRTFTGPSFFSLPGNGADDVAPSELAAELPFTPGMAVGIPADSTTGPYIELWAEDANGAELQSAVLTAPDGSEVPVKLVTESTPAPAPPPGWPEWGSIGSNYVIPVSPLKLGSKYTLTAHWTSQEGANYTQTVDFTTLPSQHAVEQQEDIAANCMSCARGYLKARIVGNKLRISVAPVSHQTLRASIARAEVVCGNGKSHCPERLDRILAGTAHKHTLQLNTSNFSLPLPPAVPGEIGLVATIDLSRFTTLHHQWRETTLELQAP